MRTGRERLLVGLRSIGWAPVGAAVAMAHVALLAARLPTGTGGARAGMMALDLGTTLLALSVAVALDDGAAELSAPVPRSLLRRRMPRVAAVGLVAAAAWVELVWVAVALLPFDGGGLEVGSLVLRSVGLAGAALGITAVVGRARRDHLALIGAGIVVVVAAALTWGDLGNLSPDTTWLAWCAATCGPLVAVVASREPLPR